MSKGDSETTELDEQLEQLGKRAEERKKEREKLAKAQEVVDLQAKEKLEEEHGPEALATVKLPRFVPGLPTRVFLLRPESAVYKRYTDEVNRATDSKNAKALREAHERFGRASWIYPETKEERAAVFERFPGILNSIGHQAARLAEGVAEEEGKG